MLGFFHQNTILLISVEDRSGIYQEKFYTNFTQVTKSKAYLKPCFSPFLPNESPIYASPFLSMQVCGRSVLCVERWTNI